MILKITLEIDLSKLNPQDAVPLSASCHKSDPAQTSPSTEPAPVPQSTESTHNLAQSGVEHSSTDQEKGTQKENSAVKENYPGEATPADAQLWYQLGGSEMQESIGASDSPFIDTHINHKPGPAQTSPSTEPPPVLQITESTHNLAQSGVEHSSTEQEKGTKKENSAVKENYRGEATPADAQFWYQLGGSEMQESIGASDSPFIETHINPRFHFTGIPETQINQFNKRQHDQNREAEGSSKRRHH
ncbi:uncharacterized protein MELLADRAFT_104464 [Melampsora larici-populina 98AG31]|uniref:Uncharacterized protein n=1 Tax=Melampsora larici-populina (strain 98AG31 / pathotype 3-4-7) TaxID=747676 RepID=F4RES5_MELLP|nr:uncharacterized protein MELLADRAFT_104464 [Melampsora larici-populina 98AG31]EGG09228.1 hypothetical protein MELLADRAFT_104464 [Melampsora larici-populina 98AG31]